MADYPPFHEAVARLVTFARSEGAQGEPLFVELDDVAFDGDGIAVGPHRGRSHDAAARAYDSAVARRLGVTLTAFAQCDGLLCCFVYAPRTEDESINHMMPDGLKLCIRVPLRQAFIATPTRWRRLRLKEWVRPHLRRSRAYLFNKDE